MANLLKLIFLINIVFVFSSCQQQQRAETKRENSDEITESIQEDIAEVSEVAEIAEETPAAIEKGIEPFPQDSLTSFYNKVLKQLFPNRVLVTSLETRSISVSPEALESVEGGGMTRKYLRVLDENEMNMEVGTIIYELSNLQYPITLALAVLEGRNTIISSTLIDLDGQVVLRISSNESGNPDIGPYNYNYYTYNDAVNLQSVLTKKMDTTKPVLSSQEVTLALGNISQLDKSSTFSFDEIAKLSNSVFNYSGFQSVITTLRGIEKYFVQDDFIKLHSLLKFKKDNRYKELEKALIARHKKSDFMEIRFLDEQNGYIEYKLLQSQVAEECIYSMTFWTLFDGNTLIGQTKKCCTMFCKGDISFTIYYQMSENYYPVTTKEIIPEIEIVKALRPKNYIDGDGFDTHYALPKKGDDIQYYAESDSIGLIWKGGTFSILKQEVSE